MKKSKKISQSTAQGFTIVELSIVTAFVAMLLIAIALIISNMMAMFQKGMTLGAVNSVGRNLISELDSTINTAPSIDSTSLCRKFLDDASDTLTETQKKCIRDGAFQFVYQEQVSDYTDRIVNDTDDVQMNGIFCAGSYTYMWNTWYGLETHNTLTLRYLDKNNTTQNVTNFKLIRFEDKTYRACQQHIDNDYDLADFEDPAKRIIDMTELANGLANKMEVDPQQGFVETSEANLDLYELVIFPVSQDVVTRRAFFSGTFILGTGNGDATIMRAEESCEIEKAVDPSRPGDETGGSTLDLGSKFNYCGINKFNFAARSAGSGV